ncbi:hypothetical protein ACOSQ2_005145 [Xanthoceras sorbifolium]
MEETEVIQQMHKEIVSFVGNRNPCSKEMEEEHDTVKEDQICEHEEGTSNRVILVETAFEDAASLLKEVMET